MKQFLVKFLIFFSILAGIAIWADLYLSKNLKKSTTLANGEIINWARLYDGKINAEVILMGSSRAVRHLDPHMIQDSFHLKAYNLGMFGLGLHQNQFMLEELIKHNPKPKYVILNIDEMVIGTRDILYQSQQIFPFMLGRKDMWHRMAEGYKGLEEEDFYVPSLRYFSQKDYVTAAFKIGFQNGDTSKPVKDELGFAPQNLPWSAKNIMLLLKGKKDSTVPIDNHSINEFKQFIRFCDSAQMKLMFVFSPEYYEIKGFLRNRDSVMDIITRISEEYKVPLIRYDNDSICYSTDNFRDPNHMNTTGVRKFNPKFAHALKQINFFKKP